jgi:hypothetical protein
MTAVQPPRSTAVTTAPEALVAMTTGRRPALIGYTRSRW